MFLFPVRFGESGHFILTIFDLFVIKMLLVIRLRCLGNSCMVGEI